MFLTNDFLLKLFIQIENFLFHCQEYLYFSHDIMTFMHAFSFLKPKYLLNNTYSSQLNDATYELDK